MTREASVTTAIRVSSFASILFGVFAVAVQANPQAAPASGKSGTDNVTPLRYARAKSGGAKIYNLADAKGVELGSADADALLAVYSESAGFLEVEPAAGLLVWVSGKYLATTDEAGVLKVTGNGINMRPSPSSLSENSYPLQRSLNKSDKVRAESRAHPEKPLAEDWVRVYAPAGTHAWCKKSDVVDATGSDLAAQFSSAQKEAHAAGKVWIEPKPASTTVATAPKSDKPGAADPKPAAAKPADEKAAAGASAQAGSELAKADELYKAAVVSGEFASAKAAYQKIVDAAPTSSAADSARAGLQKISLHEEIAQIKADKASLQVDREKRLAQAEKDLREASLSSDPLWGRFQARGWLEKEGDKWIVRWAGKVTSEIVCSSGRYDLSSYEGYQLGISGALQRGASGDGPARFDVRRIEVLDSRGTAKH
jgi:hypothetical protein